MHFNFIKWKHFRKELFFSTRKLIYTFWRLFIFEKYVSKVVIACCFSGYFIYNFISFLCGFYFIAINYFLKIISSANVFLESVKYLGISRNEWNSILWNYNFWVKKWWTNANILINLSIFEKLLLSSIIIYNFLFKDRIIIEILCIQVRLKVLKICY